MCREKAVDDVHGKVGCLREKVECYTPMGHIMRCASSRCEVVSGLQFRGSQVLTKQGSKLM